MSLINDSLKNISLKELCTVIIILYFLCYVLNTFNILHFETIWIYFLIIVYFLFKFRNDYSDFERDFLKAFSPNSIKYVVMVVCLNIFFSYGMLYLANFILSAFPSITSLFTFDLTSGYLNNSLLAFGSFIGAVLVSPISEELIFRGVVLNRLRIFIPTALAVLFSSMLFASLHGFGGIISAFVFAMCMAVLYLKTENIFVPIFAHFLNNLIAECIVFVDSKQVLFTNDLVMGVISIFAIISAVLIISSLIRELNNLK